MRLLWRCTGALFGLALLTGCGQSDAIDTSGAIYDGIAPEASITLTGAEPFWGLEIDAAVDGQHAGRFTHPEDIDPSVFSLSRFAGNNGLGFSGELAGKAVQVAITPGECSDGMSDRLYPYAATVAWGEATLIGCAFTSEAPFREAEAS